MRLLDDIADLVDMGLTKLWKLVMDREAWHAAVQGHDWVTELNWGYHAAAAAAAAKSLQSCPTLCDLIGGSPPGSSIPGILQARVLEWVAIAFSESIMVTCLTLLIMLYIYEEINIYYIWNDTFIFYFLRY